MNVLLAAAGSAVLAALLVIASLAGSPLPAAALALLVLLLALGWVDLMGLPDRIGTALLIAVPGWVALAVSLRTAPPTLSPLVAVLAGSVLLAFVGQLLRRDRSHLVESVTGTVAGQVIAVFGAGWALLPGTQLGNGAVLCVAAAVAVTRLAGAMSLSLPWAGWAAIPLGVLAGVVAMVFSDTGRLGTAALVALAISVAVAGFDRLLLATPVQQPVLAGAAAHPAAGGRGEGALPAAVSAASAAVLAVGAVGYALVRLVA